MKVIAYTSGLQPCGIADYDGHLAPAMSSRMTRETVRFPTERASRDRPRELYALRRRYRALAARSDEFDAVLLHWVTRFWNGARPVENMFPAFLHRVNRPIVMVLHEWPTVPPLHHYTGGAAARLAKRALTYAWLARDVHQLDYARWLERDMFARMSRIVVHTPDLRDRLRAAGVAADAITVERFPLHDIARPALTADETRARFGLRDRRVLLLLGHPTPRKGYDVAVRALAELPSDVVLMLVCPQRDAAARARVDELRALATEVGAGDRLLASDFLDDATLASVFAVTTLALSPFTTVTGSSSLAHFLAGGLPIVASDLPGIRDAAGAGAGIALAPPGDPHALAAAIQRVLDTPGRLAELRAGTRRYAETTTFPALARSLETLLRAAAEER